MPLLLLVLLFGCLPAAQAQDSSYTAIYRTQLLNGARPVEGTEYFLVFNDSVCFTTISRMQGSRLKIREPYGSGFDTRQLYLNRKKNLLLRQADVKNFPRLVLSDTIPVQHWQLVEEKKRILGYTCRKAIRTVGWQTVTAWYAPDLPYAFGPFTDGGLPGLILELNYQSPAMIVRAISVETSNARIIELGVGKRMSVQEYQEAWRKMNARPTNN